MRFNFLNGKYRCAFLSKKELHQLGLCNLWPYPKESGRVFPEPSDAMFGQVPRVGKWLKSHPVALIVQMESWNQPQQTQIPIDDLGKLKEIKVTLSIKKTVLWNMNKFACLFKETLDRFWLVGWISCLQIVFTSCVQHFTRVNIYQNILHFTLEYNRSEQVHVYQTIFRIYRFSFHVTQCNKLDVSKSKSISLSKSVLPRKII